MTDSTYIGNQSKTSPAINPSGQLVVSSSESIFSLVSVRPNDSETRSHLAAFVQDQSGALTERFSIRSATTPAGPVLQIYMGPEPDAGGKLVLTIDGSGNMTIAGGLNQIASPPCAPGVSNWSQDVGTQWGDYWVNGNTVLYAVSYTYSDGRESAIGPWVSAQIQGGALAQLFVPGMPSGTTGAPSGWALYRQFIVAATGEVTPVTKLGVTMASAAVRQANGMFLLLDQGNIRT